MYASASQLIKESSQLYLAGKQSTLSSPDDTNYLNIRWKINSSERIKWERRRRNCREASKIDSREILPLKAPRNDEFSLAVLLSEQRSGKRGLPRFTEVAQAFLFNSAKKAIELNDHLWSGDSAAFVPNVWTSSRYFVWYLWSEID